MYDIYFHSFLSLSLSLFQFVFPSRNKTPPTPTPPLHTTTAEPIAPPRHRPMPPQTILPAQHPMALVLETQKLRLHPFGLTDAERGQALRDRTPKIPFAMDDQHGRIPPGRVARRVPFLPRVRILPQSATEVEPQGGDFVRSEHVWQAEDAVVADEGFELLRQGLARDPVDHVPAIAASHGDRTVRVYVTQLLLDMVEAIDEVLVRASAPVAFDGVDKVLAEARRAGGVGQDDDVALLGEDGRVPARAPFVEEGGHGPAVDPEEEGVLLARGEGGGFDDEGLDVVGAGAGEVDVGDLGGGGGEMGGAVVGVAGDLPQGAGG